MNRFVWNLRYPGAVRVPGNKTAGEASEGPYVLPGYYQVRLTVGDQQATEFFEVVNDPRVQTSLADLTAQQAALFAIRDKISAAHQAVIRLREVREQVEAWRKRAGDQAAVAAAAGEILDQLAAIEDKLILPGDQKVTYGLIVRTRLNAQLASVIPVIASADAKPTAAALAVAQQYSDQIDEQIERLNGVLTGEVEELNGLIRAAGLPAIR